MSYKFKGYDWMELAECWDIDVEYWDGLLGGKHIKPIDKALIINGRRVVFTIDNEEEIIAQKIKEYIKDTLIIHNDDEENRKRVRNDLNNFLIALINESKETDYNYHAYEGILKIEDDYTFAQWIISNLEKLWT